MGLPLIDKILGGWSGDIDHSVGDMRSLDQPSALCLGDLQHNGQFGQDLRDYRRFMLHHTCFHATHPDIQAFRSWPQLVRIYA